MDDELLDLVDANDQVMGIVNRKDYASLLRDKLGYIRASELFIVNNKGKVWIPIRTADKTIAPNGYDYSVAGHVKSGEDYLDTIIREAQEEINLDISQKNIELISKIRSETIRYIRSIYILKSNESHQFNPNDFVVLSKTMKLFHLGCGCKLRLQFLNGVYLGIMDSQRILNTLDQSNHYQARQAFIAYLQGTVSVLESNDQPASEVAYNIAGMLASRFARSLKDGDPLMDIMTISGELEINPNNATQLKKELIEKIKQLAISQV